MKNIMLDIETLGDISNSVIVSIGAVRFNLETGKIGEEFYEIVDIDSCLNSGLKVTGKTIKWWLRNSQEAREELVKGGIHILAALAVLTNFIEKSDFIWSNGVRFDLGILEDAYIVLNIPIPWNFRNERDVRTLVSFAPEIKKNVIKNWDRVLHNSIDDCKMQIKYCTEIYNKIKI